MGTRTLMRKALRLVLWGFDKRLHKARFAAIDGAASIKAKDPPPNSVLLGVNLLKQFYLVRPTPTRRELGNVLVVAPTRGGKGLLATTQLFTWGGSVIVNDLKGDLFQQTAGYRATLGDVIVINPIKGIGHRYDPLASYQTEEELFLACHNLLYESKAVDPFWTDSAMQMLTQIFLAARIENQPLFPYARKIIRLGLPDASKYLHTLSPEIATQFLGRSFSSVDFENARQLYSTWATLTSKLQYFLSETVVKSLAVSDFHVSDVMLGEKPVTIYLQWKERHLKAVQPLIRLMVGSLIDELVDCYDGREGKGCKPVLMLMDEATRTAIPSLADHATTVVGRGISLWVAIQSLKALEAVYGAENAQVLRDNMESQIYYRPADVSTAEYLERRLGEKSAYARSQTEREGAEKSKGESETGIPLMTAQAIMQMKDEHILLFHRRLPPLRAHRVSWIGNPLFEKRRKIPPPQLLAIPDCEVSLNTQSKQYIDGYVNPYMLLNRERRTELEQEVSNY
jgi:type IV secretion system protein VirD4